MDIHNIARRLLGKVESEAADSEPDDDDAPDRFTDDGDDGEPEKMDAGFVEELTTFLGAFYEAGILSERVTEMARAVGDGTPEWATDEAEWTRAKEAAAAQYEPTDPAYYPIVVSLYKMMGGEV